MIEQTEPGGQPGVSLPPAPWIRQEFSTEKDELVAADGRVVCQVHVRRWSGTLRDERQLVADPVGERVIAAILGLQSSA